MSSLALNTSTRAAAISAQKPQVLQRSNLYQLNIPKFKITSFTSFRSLGSLNSDAPNPKSISRAFERQNKDFEEKTDKLATFKSEKTVYESYSLIFTHSSKWHSKVLVQMFRKGMQFKLLANISLHVNFKSSSEFENLGDLFRGSRAVKSLDLCFTNAEMSSAALQNLFTQIRRAPELKKLKLGLMKCKFNKSDLDDSLKSLNRCRSLEKLYVSFQHQGSNPSLVELAESLKSLSKLGEIGLSYKAGLNLGFEGLSDACSKLLNLKYLDLDFSAFFSINLQDLPVLEAGIQALKVVKAVRLMMCIDIEEAWIKKMIESSRYLENLQVNDMRWKLSEPQLVV